MAASGALISGGVSVASQKAQSGSVDWGKAGVDTVIGAVGGAAGGGAALGLSKLAPAAGNLGGTAVQRAVTPVFSSAGRSAVAAGTSGAASNMTDYAFNGKNQTVGGYIQNAATGFGTGAAFSLGSGRASGAVMDRLGIEPRFPTGRHVDIGDHAMAPNVARWNTAVDGVVDHVAGGVGSVVNDVLVGKDPGDYLQDGINGAISGASGPTVPLH